MNDPQVEAHAKHVIRPKLNIAAFAVDPDWVERRLQERPEDMKFERIDTHTRRVVPPGE